MRDINRDWFPEYGDKPAMNSWYPCKRGDDYWKIIRWSMATDTQTARYKVVSMRGADIGFDLTIGMARTMLMNGTRKM